MAEKKKSFLSGALILAVAGLLCKIIGAVYKIPLRNLVGAETMGVYSSVYPIYTFLLIFSTSGIPTAISKLVAEKREMGKPRAAHKVFTTSLILLAAIGTVTTAIMLVFAAPIARVLSIESGEPVAAIAFSLLFVSVLSAFRGYFQGLLNMNPTAITQLAEQVVKLAAGFYFAITWYNKYGYILGAAGALLGITISEAAALLLIVIMYLTRRKRILHGVDLREEDNGRYVRALMRIAIPMTLGAAIKPLVDSIDSVMAMRLVESNFAMPAKEVKLLYGFLKSDCGTLINMPTVFTVALSMALVPAISAALVSENGKRNTQLVAGTGLKLSLIVGLPCTVGFFTMAREVLSLLYSYVDQTEEFVLSGNDKLGFAGTYLQILAFGVLFLAVVQTAAGILQGMGRVLAPVVNLGIGMLVKILLNLILIPRLGMTGVPIGTITCYAIAAILDVICVIRSVRLKLDISDVLLRPLGATALMTAALVAMRFILNAHPSGGTMAYTIGSLSLGGTKAKLVTVAVIGCAAIVYFIGLVLFNVFDEDDFDLMPGGQKLKKLLKKLHVKVREVK